MVGIVGIGFVGADVGARDGVVVWCGLWLLFVARAVELARLSGMRLCDVGSFDSNGGLW